MGCRRVWEQAFGIEHKQLVDSVRQNLTFYIALDARAGNDGVKLNAKLVGELAALGEQFLRHFGNGGAFYLAIYEYVVHCFIF